MFHARTPTAAVIGSFRRHYGDVLAAIEAFRAVGWRVLSPAGTEVVDRSAEFVRFTSDRGDLSDEEVQSVTLENIMAANLTFVVAPGGYVGRTTCYEIGRLLQARRPIFFSERPLDLPLLVPTTHLGTAQHIARLFSGAEPTWMFTAAVGVAPEIERRLTDARS